MATSAALICADAQLVRNEIYDATHDRVEIKGVLSSVDELLANIENVDLVFLNVGTLKALARHHRRATWTGRQRQPDIILALADDELRDALTILHMCRGLLFREHDLDKLEAILVLAREGYCGVPSEVLPNLITDRVRIALLETLSPMEQHTLSLLGEAMSNRSIAHALNIGEPMAKSLVRAVLNKLRLNNRTEAAVFATRCYAGANTEVTSQNLPSQAGQVAS